MCSLGALVSLLFVVRFAGCRYVGYKIQLVNLTYYCLVCDTVTYSTYEQFTKCTFNIFFPLEAKHISPSITHRQPSRVRNLLEATQN